MFLDLMVFSNAIRIGNLAIRTEAVIIIVLLACGLFILGVIEKNKKRKEDLKNHDQLIKTIEKQQKKDKDS
jgi:hypothetical protein